MAFDVGPPQAAAPAHSRAPGTRLRPSRPSSRRTNEQRTRSRASRRRNIERASFSTPRRPRGRHGPAVRAAILVEPGGHLRMPLAETLWRNADPDADREAPLCRRDHLAWVARQLNVPYIFSSRLHGRLALDHPLSGGAGRQEWNQVGDRRLAKASLPAYTSNSANSSPRASVRNRLADPDELPDKMSNGQSGGTIFGLPGGLKLQFSAPQSRDTASTPFVTSPSTVFVPSEHR